jgi:hypothetical protein
MIPENIVKAVISGLKGGKESQKEYFSETRDIFAARLQSFIIENKKYLEAAVIGEIGNNTFDHNFIFENNSLRGVYCNMAYQNQYTVLADFGRGIKQSLMDVLPSIQSDTEALEIAFTKQISGRSLEQRGNGLKFVSETIRQNNWHLFFQSGSGCCSIDNAGVNFFTAADTLPGCLAIINFNGSV